MHVFRSFNCPSLFLFIPWWIHWETYAFAVLFNTDYWNVVLSVSHRTNLKYPLHFGHVFVEIHIHLHYYVHFR